MYCYMINSISKIPDDGYLVTCRAVSSHESSVGWLTKLEQENSLSPVILRTQLTELVEQVAMVSQRSQVRIPFNPRRPRGSSLGGEKSKRARKKFGQKKVKSARRGFKPDFFHT